MKGPGLKRRKGPAGGGGDAGGGWDGKQTSSALLLSCVRGRAAWCAGRRPGVAPLGLGRRRDRWRRCSGCSLAQAAARPSTRHMPPPRPPLLSTPGDTHLFHTGIYTFFYTPGWHLLFNSLDHDDQGPSFTVALNKLA